MKPPMFLWLLYSKPLSVITSVSFQTQLIKDRASHDTSIPSKIENVNEGSPDLCSFLMQ